MTHNSISSCPLLIVLLIVTCVCVCVCVTIKTEFDVWKLLSDKASCAMIVMYRKNFVVKSLDALCTK